MTVGVLLPTFNRRGYLALALGSALAQDHRDLEVLVADNGSTDGTAEAMARVSDPRVTYRVNEGNLGLVGSINANVPRFSPAVEWITVLGDDDLLAPGFVSACLRAAEGRPGAVLLDASRSIVDGEGRETRKGKGGPPVASPIEYLRSRLERTRDTFLTGLLFRRDAFDAVGGYPPFTTGLASDDALIFALALRGGGVVHVPEASASVRFHEGAESHAPGDLSRQLATMDDYVAYCRKALTAAGVRGGEAGPYEEVLLRYREAVNTGSWTRHFLCALRGLRGRERRERLRELRRIGADPAVPFTPRVRLLSAALRFVP